MTSTRSASPCPMRCSPTCARGCRPPAGRSARPCRTGRKACRSSYLREFCAYWGEKYDWRAREAALNAFPQFTTTVDELDLHFYHLRSHHEGALPLLLTHGWPGSVAEFAKVMGPLADPPDPADAFHVSPRRCPGSGSPASRRRPAGASRGSPTRGAR